MPTSLSLTEGDPEQEIRVARPGSRISLWISGAFEGASVKVQAHNGDDWVDYSVVDLSGNVVETTTEKVHATFPAPSGRLRAVATGATATTNIRVHVGLVTSEP